MLPDFDSGLYPKCDQGPPPSPFDTSSAAITKLEFLAAYYEINQGYSRLLAARAQNARPEEERAALEAIERALLARDALEDKYARLGVAATAEFVDGYARNVNFVQPHRPLAGSSLAMLFAVRPPSPRA
jgi:hypothetical protein